MSTTYIITFYAIFVPISISAIIIGFSFGYRLAKRQKFPHKKIQNDENANK